MPRVRSPGGGRRHVRARHAGAAVIHVVPQRLPAGRRRLDLLHHADEVRVRRRDVPALVRRLGGGGRLLHPLLAALGGAEQHLAFGTLVNYGQPEVALQLLQLGPGRPLDDQRGRRDDGRLAGLRDGDQHRHPATLWNSGPRRADWA